MTASGRKPSPGSRRQEAVGNRRAGDGAGVSGVAGGGADVESEESAELLDLPTGTPVLARRARLGTARVEVTRNLVLASPAGPAWAGEHLRTCAAPLGRRLLRPHVRRSLGHGLVSWEAGGPLASAAEHAVRRHRFEAQPLVHRDAGGAGLKGGRVEVAVAALAHGRGGQGGADAAAPVGLLRGDDVDSGDAVRVEQGRGADQAAVQWAAKRTRAPGLSGRSCSTCRTWSYWSGVTPKEGA